MLSDEVKQNYELAKIDYITGMKYKEIAEKYGVTINTVKSWKTRYRWNRDKKGMHTKSKKVCIQKGGQPGNKNAVGHGGTGPPGNRNAVKTGEFETLFFNTLEPEEKELIELVQLDKEKLLLQEIQLLTVREHRMLRRIELLKQSNDVDPEEKVPEGMTVVKFSCGMEKGKITELKDYECVLGQIQAIEEALTRVQARKQKAIEALHKFGYDDARLDLETMKLEFEMLKQDGSDDEAGDDGFLDAMNHAAGDVWGDVDE